MTRQRHRSSGQKKQRKYYSGKKKKHSIKTQVIADKKSKKIICTNYINGKVHDFEAFKSSKVHIASQLLAITDTGFLGLNKLHSNTQMPKKKSKNHPLTKEEKKQNKLDRKSVV